MLDMSNSPANLRENVCLRLVNHAPYCVEEMLIRFAATLINEQREKIAELTAERDRLERMLANAS